MLDVTASPDMPIAHRGKTGPPISQTVEDSIYVAPDAVGCGVGGRLLDSLLAECTGAGVREVIAVIVDADGVASLALHRNRGFVDAGRLSFRWASKQWPVARYCYRKQRSLTAG